MASFGYLEIYWPDNPVESFILTKPATAIGRSSGNDLVIDRDGVSRYHAKIVVEETFAQLTDLESVNGVYVDGVRIAVNDPRVLKGGEEIQLADVRLVFYPPFSPDDETIAIHLEDTAPQIQAGLFSVQVALPDVYVVPGAHIQASLMIENLSNELNRYSLQVEGVPSEWVRIQRSEIELDGEEQTTVLVNFKPLRRSETRPQNYPVKFRVIPKGNPELAVTTETVLSVGTYSGYGVVMGTPKITDGQPFELHIHNQGNGQLGMKFTGHDAQKILDFQFHTPHVVLNGGERRTIRGTIKPKRGNLFGSTREYRYDIVSQAQDASQFQAPVSGIYVAKALFPAWMATLAIPLVGVVVIGIVILLASLFSSEPVNPPSIQSLTVEGFAVNEPAQITVGEPVKLLWQASHTEVVEISYGRAEQPKAVAIVSDESITSYGLTLETSGLYQILVLAKNEGEEIAQLSTTITVLPKAELKLDPNTLWRGVEQNLNFTWAVEGAMSPLQGEISSPSLPNPVQITGQNAVSQKFRAEQETQNITFVLRILGFDGTETQTSLQVAVSDPSCDLKTNANPRVYAGPGTNYANLSGFDNLSLLPIARDASSQWLQTAEGWVLGANFDCPFALSDLVEALDIPATPTR